IDAHRWEGDDARDLACRDKPAKNPRVPLRPPTDPARAKMIRSFRWSRRARIAVTGVPGGTYAVYAYVWEETKPQRFSISLNGREVVRGYDSGPPGCWRRLGPWTTEVREGEVVLITQGGDANLSGIELWQRGGGKK
ncbi:MAG: PSD1 and planctomycete cytochrome C domain-containing protein, partial [Planctomycetota bacterium]